jgi:hypothetical protein
MRTISIVLILALAVPIGTTGCETISEHKETAVGVGVGAAAGAVLGGLISKNTTGVVVGGLLGALGGGAIGYYLERRDRDRDEAVKQTGYEPSQGTLVQVEDVQVTPNPVSPGRIVYPLVRYTVLTPDSAQTLTVRETRELRRGGELVANPTTEFTRANGTFTRALPITLPESAPRGAYELTVTVAVGDRSDRKSTTFTVQ